MIRIWFFWTPSLATSVLRDILEYTGFEVVFVVTNPDKPFGREQIMKPSPVKELALKHNICILQPVKVRWNTEFLKEIASYNCDYFIVVAYGKIVPLELLEIPKKLCINVHGSILPAYRGASPIQAALLHGEKETGVTIMKMSEGMDEGDILKIRTVTIERWETSGTLFDKFAQISWRTLIDTLLELEHGGITPISQDHTRATYCKKIEKEDGLIDWSMSAEELYHKWQAYTPWPGVFTYYEGKRLLLEKVSLFRHSDEGRIQVLENWNTGSFVPQDYGNIGTVIKLEDGCIGVICGNWILTLEQVKLEWKKSQNIKDFVNGNQHFIWYNFL